MRLGSEFTFHGSISKQPQKKGPKMYRLELRDGKDWMPMARLLVTEPTEAVMTSRGRKKGTHYRFVDLDKPPAKPRVRKAAKPTETSDNGEGK